MCPSKLPGGRAGAGWKPPADRALKGSQETGGIFPPRIISKSVGGRNLATGVGGRNWLLRRWPETGGKSVGGRKLGYRNGRLSTDCGVSRGGNRPSVFGCPFGPPIDGERDLTSRRPAGATFVSGPPFCLSRVNNDDEHLYNRQFLASKRLKKHGGK